MRRFLYWLFFGRQAKFPGLLSWFAKRRYGFEPDERDYLALRPHAASSRLSSTAHLLKHGLPSDPNAVNAYLATSLNKLWGLSTSRPKAIFVTHDLSATGAPLLALELVTQLQATHDVWVISGGTGKLWAWFERVAARVTVIGASQPNNIEDLPGFEDFQNAELVIINSIEGVTLVDFPEALGRITVVLVHEFAHTTASLERKIGYLKRAALIVFSSKVTRDSFVNRDSTLAGHRILIQAQPLLASLPSDREPSVKLSGVEVGSKPTGKRQKILLGAGSIDYRKGVDLFIETCRQIEQLKPNSIQYVWMGAGLDLHDFGYGPSLLAQVELAGLNDVFTFVEHGNFRSLLQQADAFLVSSRADPLPNVALDALGLEIPTVCFRGTTGLVELLEDFELGELAVPFADCQAAALQIAGYLSNPKPYRLRLKRIATTLGQFGATDYLRVIREEVRRVSS